MNKPILAVDFDGTCVKHTYPDVGDDVPHAVRVLKRIVTETRLQIILWTMRSGKPLEEAVEWFKARGIPLYAVNENPEDRTWTTSPKVYANLYIDDSALGCPLIVPWRSRPYVDWLKIEQLLEEREILPRRPA